MPQTHRQALAWEVLFVGYRGSQAGDQAETKARTRPGQLVACSALIAYADEDMNGDDAGDRTDDEVGGAGTAGAEDRPGERGRATAGNDE